MNEMQSEVSVLHQENRRATRQATERAKHSCWRTTSQGGRYKRQDYAPRGDGDELVESRDWSLLAAAAMEIVHGDVDVDLATRRLDA